MRLAFANSSHIWGGAEHITATFLLAFQERGHDVALLCQPQSPFLDRLGDRIACYPTLGGFDTNPIAVLRSVHRLRRLRPQVLVTMTQKDPRIAGVAARLLDIPVLMRQPMDVGFRRSLRHRIYYGMVPTHYVANSMATRRSMVDSASWLDATDISVIYNGIDVERFESATPADLGLPEGAFVVGFAGRFEDRKGILELMQAWPQVAAAVPHAQLVLVGEGGPHAARVRDWADADERVHLAGFRSDMPEVMAAFDVLAVPSWFEGFGLVVAEAMACGRPVVAAAASNLPELLDDGVEGLLVPVRDADALAAAITALARDPQRRRAMGSAGRERAGRDFSVRRMLDDYESLLASIASPARI